MGLTKTALERRASGALGILRAGGEREGNWVKESNRVWGSTILDPFRKGRGGGDKRN